MTVATILPLIFAVLDVLIVTILMCHGNQWHLFPDAWNDINFNETTVDFWYFSIIRFSFMCGALIGLCYNKTKGQDELKKNFGVIVSFMIMMMIYGAAKLLIYSEQDVFHQGGSMLYWFWAIFIYSQLACIYPMIVWYKLGSYEMKKPDNVVLVDVIEDENTPLIGNNHSINTEENYTKSENQGTKTTNSAEDNANGSSSSSGDEDEENGDKKGFTKLVNKATIGKILRYTRKDAWLIILGIVFLTGAAVAEVFIPLYTGKVISGIAIDRDTNKFIKNIMIMALISIAASVCAGLRGGFMMTAINRLNIRIKNTLFQSISKQEMAFYDKTKTGEIISRLTSDTQTMSTAIGLNFNVFLRSFVKAIGTIIFMFRLSWRLSIITFMGLPLVVIVSKLYGNYYKKLQTEVQDKLAKANEVAEEVCSSIKTVRSFANELDECDRYNTRLLEVYKVQLKQAVAYAGFMWSNEISSLALITGTLGYGGHLVITNLMDSDNLIAFILYQLNLGDCLQNIGTVYTGLMQALGAAEKVFRIIEREPEIDLSAGKQEPDQLIGHVKFDNVSFVYPSRPKNQVLKNVSFEAEPGQVTALVGPSGGGKSSCVNLLQHLYEPVVGSITIDGINVREFTHKYLHEKMTMVGQEPVLFSRTISENIAYGMPSSLITERDVVQAAMDANAHQFITEMSDQYKTEAGEKGTQLSGGQKQRVAIARALVRKPRILLLDEATSALDTQSEYLVQEALRKNIKDRTVLVIAHRLSTVEQANKIVVIDNGEVKEEGTHPELMKKNGIYHKLVYRQLHRHHDLSQNNQEKIKEIKESPSKKKKKKRSKNIDIISSSILSSSCESHSSFISGSFKSHLGKASRASTISRSSSSDGVDEIPNI